MEGCHQQVVSEDGSSIDSQVDEHTIGAQSRKPPLYVAIKDLPPGHQLQTALLRSNGFCFTFSSAQTRLVRIRKGIKSTFANSTIEQAVLTMDDVLMRYEHKPKHHKRTQLILWCKCPPFLVPSEVLAKYDLSTSEYLNAYMMPSSAQAFGKTESLETEQAKANIRLRATEYFEKKYSQMILNESTRLPNRSEGQIELLDEIKTAQHPKLIDIAVQTDLTCTKCCRCSCLNIDAEKIVTEDSTLDNRKIDAIDKPLDSNDIDLHMSYATNNILHDERYSKFEDDNSSGPTTRRQWKRQTSAHENHNRMNEVAAASNGKKIASKVAKMTSVKNAQTRRSKKK